MSWFDFPRMVCRRQWCAAAALLLAAALAAGGCASTTISLRSVPKSPLINELELTSYSGPKASSRTVQLLRVYNLSNGPGGDVSPLLKQLQLKIQ